MLVCRNRWQLPLTGSLLPFPPPGQVTYNTLLASYAHRGAWCEALEALSHVLASAGEGVNPNTGERCAVVSCAVWIVA